LRAEADPAMLAAEAREFGFERVPPAEPFDPAARERALDALLKHGASPAARRPPRSSAGADAWSGGGHDRGGGRRRYGGRRRGVPT
jgi:hypothetical protein